MIRKLHPTAWVLFFLWIAATSYNLNKAFHIDDTFHLEAAKHIVKHPLKPMSGSINWEEVPQRMWQFNQPPLYFYSVAVASRVVGFSEWGLHLFQSIFVGLALFFFSRVVVQMQPAYVHLALFGLAFSPAFWVNQNLMIDLPLLALSTGMVYFLLRNGQQRSWDYIFIVLLLSSALLMKYSSLPLWVVLVMGILLKREYKFWWAPTMILVILAGWSTWNLWEFGSIHLSGKGGGIALKSILNRGGAFWLGLGALTPFGWLCLLGFLRVRNGFMLTVLLLAGMVSLWIGGYAGIINISTANQILRVLFLINGFLLIICTLLQIWVSFFKKRDRDLQIIGLWWLGVLGFMLLFVPFMASRHILLTLPPMLLLIEPMVMRSDLGSKIFTVLLAFVITLSVSFSDWDYAHFYRNQATIIAEGFPESERVFTVGHWGWQWYSKQEGMIFYNSQRDTFKTGNYLVRPHLVHQQSLSPTLPLREINRIVHQPTGWTFLNGVLPKGSMYHSSFQQPPWQFSRQPFDTISVFIIE